MTRFIFGEVFTDFFESINEVPFHYYLEDKVSCLLYRDRLRINGMTCLPKVLTHGAQLEDFEQFVDGHLGHFAETGHAEDTQLFVLDDQRLNFLNRHFTYLQ